MGENSLDCGGVAWLSGSQQPHNLVYTVFVRLVAHCAWTTTEQSTYFKPIVMG